MKKLLCMILALCFVFALCACGGETGEQNADNGTTTEPTQTQPTENQTPEEDDTPIDDGKIAYTVKVVDEAGNPIAAVKQVQVCDETNICSIILMTDGVGTMRLAEAEYHATLLSMPEGYDYAGEETEFSFDSDNSCTITLKAVA